MDEPPLEEPEKVVEPTPQPMVEEKIEHVVEEKKESEPTVQPTHIPETKDERLLTAFYKVNDWYSKHNFGTRFAMITFVMMYVVAVFYTLDFGAVQEVATTTKGDVEATVEAIKAASKNSTNYEVVEITGYFAFFAFLVITLGDNALSKIIDLIAKIKGGK